ncbi:papain family cysteine protease, partial [Teladorsagia circumcincta]
DSCRPYEFPPRGWRKPPGYNHTLKLINGSPECVRECQPGYNKTYEEDKYYGRTGYYIPQWVPAIQREIMKRGPVTSGYTIYADFLHYRRGIYRRIAGRTIGGHAVKIVGWGKEGHIPYWIVANREQDLGNRLGRERMKTALIVSVFATLVASGIAGRHGGRKHHDGPLLPPYLKNVTVDARRDYLRIVFNDTLTIVKP